MIATSRKGIENPKPKTPKATREGGPRSGRAGIVVSGKPTIPNPQVFCKLRLATGLFCLMGALRTASASRKDAESMPTPRPWTARVWQEYRADNLTRGDRDVLLTLNTFRGAGGLCIPSHATLADRAGCSSRTVQRALQQARRLGLVSWVERRVRAAWRWLRTSNAYRLERPAEPVQPGSRPAWPRRSTTGQNGRGGESQRFTKAATLSFMREAAALPDLLAARRGVIEARLLNGWRG